MDIFLQNMLKEVNKKLDQGNQKEGLVEKKLECLSKCLGGLIGRVNKVSVFILNCKFLNTLLDKQVSKKIFTRRHDCYDTVLSNTIRSKLHYRKYDKQ